MKLETKQEILSKKGKENLEKNRLIRRQDSMFLSIDPDEELVLEFNPELIDVRELAFEGVIKRKIVYTVIEQITKSTKYWSVSQRTSAKIDSYLSKGQLLLKVKRTGSGLETAYNFSIP